MKVRFSSHLETPGIHNVDPSWTTSADLNWEHDMITSHGRKSAEALFSQTVQVFLAFRILSSCGSAFAQKPSQEQPRHRHLRGTGRLADRDGIYHSHAAVLWPLCSLVFLRAGDSMALWGCRLLVEENIMFLFSFLFQSHVQPNAWRFLPCF